VDKWRKAISFTLCFMALTYMGGFMLLIGAHQAAKLVGVSVVIAVDEDAGGAE
jgi:hypothetical protein